MNMWNCVQSLLKHHFTTTQDSHIIHIAGVGHLLDVDAGCFLNSGQDAAHSSLHQVLDVHEAAPNVAHVIKWVSCWTRIPKPEKKKKRNTQMMFLYFVERSIYMHQMLK